MTTATPENTTTVPHSFGSVGGYGFRAHGFAMSLNDGQPQRKKISVCSRKSGIRIAPDQSM